MQLYKNNAFNIENECMFLMAVPKVNRTTRSLSTSNTINVQQQMIKVIWNMIIRL